MESLTSSREVGLDSTLPASKRLRHSSGEGTSHSKEIEAAILDGHKEEVWFLQFSHNGRYLASSSRDGIVIIWEVEATDRVRMQHTLVGHQAPVSYISWSPDDREILSCGVEETVKRWDIQSGVCLHTYEKDNCGMVSCAWSLLGPRIFTCINDGSISIWNLEGRELECWEGTKTKKISDLATTSDGEELITICGDYEILFFGIETESERFLPETQPIVSFSLTEDRKYLLVSLISQEHHLWKIDGPEFDHKTDYRGLECSRFVVRSCVGGVEQGFIASGSEDSQVYIWNRQSGDLIRTLEGHTGIVNCVSWNPADPRMLASASDDWTVRIWGNLELANAHGANGR